ncbi:acyltransferase [Mycobacterium sp. Y57]|uniref:acyltransferase family protein n=1 Tax=Mycolicibacterium xanthum TaxID=2796469 RepID=UPI001C858358|nr:acyltransferase [Mycolicibacterium xanthum]MBX7434618.1 acyltransferase [Mycolicibacterium xanthum]
MTTSTPTPDSTPTGRDRAVDVARLSALMVVMFGHCALLLATIDSSGVRVGNSLGELPHLAAITWILQVMPLFFLAGGAAGGYGYHPDTPWGAWLFTRAQRLCRPVFWYLAVWSTVLVVVGLTLGPESAARLGGESVALLWFLGVYVLALAFVPALTRLGSSHAIAVALAALLAATAAMDGIRFAVGSPMAGVANFVLVWLIPMVLGVGYARHLIGVRAAAVLALSALAAQIALVVLGPYDVPLVATGVERISNVSPPTLVLAMQCTWMSGAFVVMAGALRRWAQRPRVWRFVATGNAGAMTLYLWHIPAIAIAAFGLHAAGLDAFDVHAPGFWGLLALRAAVFAVIMLALFTVLSPLEHRPLPWWDTRSGTTGVRATAAGALICVAGVALVSMAKFGLGDTPGWTAMACFVAAAVAARIVAGAVTRPRVHADSVAGVR